MYFKNSVTSSLKTPGGLSDLASAQANPNSALKTVSQTRAPLTTWFGSTHLIYMVPTAVVLHRYFSTNIVTRVYFQTVKFQTAID